MAEQFGEKSHDATPHRRQQAREQGQVPKSQDLGSAVLLLAAVTILMWLGGSLATYFGNYAKRQLSGVAPVTDNTASFLSHSQSSIADVAKVLLPVFGVLVLVAVVVNVSQVGFLFLPNKLAPEWNRLSPLKGFGRLFAIANFVRFGFGIVKLIIIAGVAVASVWQYREELFTMGAMEVGQLAVLVMEITLWTCLKIGAALLILALLDYAFQRWKFEEDLKMTTQEVREEMKQLQGDPEMIARRRTVQRQLVMNRLNTAVPKADVVVTNPTELAIAIQYDPETMAAPVVVAKGAGVIAQRIRRLALENDIPIIERKPLARALYADVEVNNAIPSEQYAAVAEVLKYVYELKGKSLPDLSRAA